MLRWDVGLGICECKIALFRGLCFCRDSGNSRYTTSKIGLVGGIRFGRDGRECYDK